LVSAANRGAFDIVDALLRTNTQWSPTVLGHALVAGARFGDIAFCREMLRRGAPISTRDAQKKTALMSAAESGVPEVVALMLAAGARPSEADERGETALHWVGKDTPLNRLEPSAMNRRAVVDLLVRAGADIDAYDELEFTPLTEALNERPEVVAALIAYGADVNRRVGRGSTALGVRDNPETMQLLLEAGADPFTRDEFGRTALGALKAWNELRRESGFRDRRAYERGLQAEALLERWISTHPQKSR
jgi:ankyrin repeat protein